MIQSMNALNEKGVQFLLIGLGIWMAMELQYSLAQVKRVRDAALGAVER